MKIKKKAKRTTLGSFSLILIILLCSCGSIDVSFTPPKGAITPTPSNTSTQTLSQELSPSILENGAPFNISWDDRSLFRQNLTPAYHDVLERLPGSSIYHLALSISDPPILISGIEEIRYTNQEGTPLSEIDLAIFPEILGGTIEIKNSSVDGQLVSPIFSKGLMRIPLANQLNPGQKTVLHLEFSVTVPTLENENYYGILEFTDGILSLAHAYPTILVYNSQGWNNETPDLIGDPLFSDTSFYLVSIDAPDDYVLVASGTQVSRQEEAGRQQALFADGPARDFYLAASKDFQKHSKNIGEVTINCYLPDGLSSSADSAINTAETAINDFSRRFAPYPYTEFDIVSINTSAGGVEFPGMTAIGEKIFGRIDTLEGVLAHEVGHQWFYNMVGNSTQDQPWLDESLVQYITCQYFIDKYGEQAEQSCFNSMKARWDTINDEKIPLGEPVSYYSSEEYSAIIYGRGPFFFQALQQQIGTDAFNSMIQDYTNSYIWDIGTTEGFKQIAEQHCGCDLTPLFQEWITP